MTQLEKRAEMVRFLKWIRQYGGWWYAICSAEQELSPNMMKLLIEQLKKAQLEQLIFVLMMVHRKEALVDNFLKRALLEMMIENWEEQEEEIIKSFIDHLE